MSALATYGVPAMVIVVGLALGAAFAARARTDTVHPGRGRAADLTEAHKDAVTGLRALELERHKLPDSEYASQREALLDQGSAALRELEEHVPEPISSPKSGEPAGNDAIRASLEAQRATLGDEAVDAALRKLDASAKRVSPAWVGAAYALAAVALVAMLWFAIQNNAVDRREGAPMTGIQELGTAPEDLAPRAEPPPIAAFRARIEANADDLEAHNELTEWAIGNQDLASAMSHNSEALRVNPADADARTFRAYLMMSIGRSDEALEMLEALRAEQPDHLKSTIYYGLIALSSGDAAAAIPALEAAIAAQPEGVEFLEERLAAARARVAGGPAAPPGADPAPRPSGATAVASGQIRVDDSTAGALTGNEIVFVTVRDPAGGPPLAAKRLPARFPLLFEISSADAIAMGGAPRAFPALVDLGVRIDSDGDAGTRPPSDPATTVRGLALGTTELVIEL